MRSIDPLQITLEEKKILEEFQQRRSFFEQLIRDKGIVRVTCPGCGYPTLTERDGYEICIVCNWEDDGQDNKDADEIWGGPNGRLSLTRNRLNIGKELNEMAGGKPDTTANALEKIEYFEQKRNEIGDRMTGEEPREHPIHLEWKEAEKDLIRALAGLK